ncbi:lytic transglycosylase [Paracoccus sp. PS-1]|uniref:transglycosylase SLT domain-containing protein n=1 Tax=unclassified Paracoccus (in: a-proteobacteria) TaxID=2688777 RepID=UPI00048F8BBB|nr:MULTISPECIES: lytic transglycosylase [unclassified Paracoccus (in: a-proteobacteria)]MDQ7260737.1 lytic transglycosylase [Paracoccus sp. PS1]RQP06115.1 MAG: lytic transglycosylase [Paracoccus sp. BP8]UFM65704.1 lytic transglycosylase [Paracoccus sp. MA]
MNRFLKLAIVGLVASCGGGGNYKAPRNLENACALAAERPAYMRAMKATERRWGIPVHVQMATIHQESKFIGDARTPHQYALGIIPIGRQSSAYGYSQALDSTWDDYRKQTGNRRARRDNIKDATDFMGWYMNDSARMLGISKWDAGAQYLAYHEGRSGFAKGSHNSKPWLVNVAGKVQTRSELYRMQLASCR